MSRRSRPLVVAAVLGAVCVALATPSAAAQRNAAPETTHRGAAVTYTGAFEFEGLAGAKAGKGCSGEGAFGEMKPGAKVTISEQDSAGDFSVIATGKVSKGKVTTASIGTDKVCRMKVKAKAATGPADDSTVYLEIKGVAFNIRFPAADVADGDLGDYTCEYSDNSCATIVGAD